uniref:Potassium channel subfamily U member 1 n=1 Tax=Cebus imitator TaxID=2715852 RepID=A0A2K5S839_CEBIM
MFRLSSDLVHTKLKDENGEDVAKISCTTEIQTAFILSSILTFFSGLIILLIFRLIWRAAKKRQINKATGIILELFTSGRIDKDPIRSLRLKGQFRDRIEMLLSAQTFVGQVTLKIFIFANCPYFFSSPVRSCSSYEDTTIPIDLTFNAFFSFYFGLRFMAADDKIKFWLEMNSMVDIFTIPPAFISYYLKSNWLGTYSTALCLSSSSNSVKFSKLLSVILSTCFTAAGFIHLVENFGDPWLKGRNSQTISYFESIYLVMMTTSTVGFGDVVPKTSLGRTFIMFFTLGSLILFANFIPEMVELFANKRKYTNDPPHLFIVVCGNITVDSVTAFLRNFLRHKSGEINTEIVFLGETPPSLELETIFKCYLAYTTFISGSAMKWEDLRRVVESAEACLIIANPLCSDSHAEDISNIMRVLSIKNYFPTSRVIIQILQSHNKVYLPVIPSWNWNAGDNIICFAELKLGFLAQGCLVPGLCTLLTSLFVEQNKKVSPKQTWQKHFLNGMKNKILTQRLSDDFVGMSFPEVAQLCFLKMHLLLIAIEYKSLFKDGFCGLILNPPAQVKIHRNTLGFFIAETPKEVKRALFYCAVCHDDVLIPERITNCGCKSKNQKHIPVPSVKLVKRCIMGFSSRIAPQDSLPREGANIPSISARTLLQEAEQDFDQLDSSGMFHWCKTIPLDNVILKRTDKLKHEFQNHIVACVFGDAHSALVGLRNFVMPLRASNYTRQELKDIVFIGSLDYLQREWRFLRNFPQIYILPGSALYPGDLHAANIEQCSMCVVLSPPSKSSSSQTPVDSETIMATLIIRSLRADSSSDPSLNTPGYTRSNEKSNCQRVPILTELKNPSNIHFIEQLGGLERSLQETNLHLSTAFSTGAVFSGSFLDSLLATAFYNYHVLELLQMLVTGGRSSQLEQHLDKDKVYDLSDSCTTLLSGRKRCKLGLLSLHQTILSDVQPRNNFGQLFCGSLDLFGILCVGLYRVIDEEDINPENKRGVFVIIRPANEFELLPSDLVFCAIPFSTACYKRNEETSLQKSNEIVNNAPQTTETYSDTNFPPTIDPGDETLYLPVYSYESRSNSRFAKQTSWDQSRTQSVTSSQMLLGDNAKENGRQTSDKEVYDEDSSVYSEPH